ncbi:MAG: hypothetical protein JW820_18600 [Spirochaetales bacterium]|nr:hypothetical protein [Spirochaetales bacterium]
MPVWATILVAVLGGSLAGGVATVLAARIHARHDSRMRVHDRTAAAYAEALAAIEQVFQLVHGVFSELKRTLEKTPPPSDRALAAARAKARVQTNAAVAAASAREAPAKLLASPKVLEALAGVDRFVAEELITGIMEGQGDALAERMDGVYSPLVDSMRTHLEYLSHGRWRPS